MNCKDIISNKKGMTLVEVIVAMVIALIIIGATSSMIISGTNFFGKTASGVQDKEIARSVLNFVTTELRFATSISVYNVDSAQPNPQINEGQIFTMNEQNQVSSTYKGMLAFQRPDDHDAPRNVFGKDFYHGREIGIRVQTVSADEPKVITVFVDVFNDDKLVTTDSATIQIPNVMEGSPPDTKQSSAPTNHAYIVYTANPPREDIN